MVDCSALDITDDDIADLEAHADAYLADLHISSWGSWFNVSDPEIRKDAAAWLVRSMLGVLNRAVANE